MQNHDYQKLTEKLNRFNYSYKGNEDVIVVDLDPIEMKIAICGIWFTMDFLLSIFYVGM